MKYSHPFLLLFIILVTFSCSKDDAPIEAPIQSRFDYPVSFTYSGFDVNPTEYFSYSNSGFNSIIPTTYLAEVVDSILDAEIFNPVDDIIGFKEFKLLNDSTTNIVIDSGDPNEPGMELNLTSYINMDTLVVVLDPADDLVLKLNIAEDEDRLSVCSHMLSLLYYDSFIERRRSTGFDLEDCMGREKVAIMEDFVDDPWVVDKIAYGDTLILNVSDVVFEME